MDDYHPDTSFDLSEDQINEISNFQEGLQLLKERNLILNYLTDIEDIKEILRLKYIRKTEMNYQVSKTDVIYENYSDIIKQITHLLVNVKQCTELVELKKEIGEIYKISGPQINTKIKELEETMKRKKFPIFISGEANAGKSTFINLIAGTDLVPTDCKMCTRIICEIKNSDKEDVTLKSKDKPKRILKLSEKKEIAACIKQESGINYQRAIFRYPIQFLEKSAYLVDSPGIGDNSLLESMAYDYLENKAHTFIFVLNATNSSGLNHKSKQLIKKTKQIVLNEIEKYITDYESISKLNDLDFPFKKAIFILNQWDIVQTDAKSTDEINEIRNNIIRDLKSIWHESTNEKEQIFFISARKANEWQRHGIVQRVVLKIRASIKKSVGSFYLKNVEKCLELLNLLLNSMEKKILQKINIIVDKKYCELYTQDLHQRLEGLIKDMDSRKSKIREQLKPKIESMAVHLTEHLKSKIVEDRILLISEGAIEITDNMDLLSTIFKKFLETKLYDEIKIWEQDNKQMEKLYIFLNDSFVENLVQISDTIAISNILLNKESLLKAWNTTNQNQTRCREHKMGNPFINALENIFIISTIALLSPVVALAGLIASPLVLNHLWKEKKINDKKLHDYKCNPKEYLRKMMSENLKNLTSNDIRRLFFDNVQRKCEDHIRGFDMFIKVEINEKQQLLTEIENEYRKIPEILSYLNSLYYQVEDCYGEYHSLKNNYEGVRDIDSVVESTTYDKFHETLTDATDCIARGKYGIVFRHRNYPDMVFKIYKEKFIHANARFQMLEIYLLSSAPNDNILKCKKFSILENENKVMLALENVECNLHQYLVDNEKVILSKQEKHTSAWKAACDFVIDVSTQICKGLEYLYSYDPRMVHPDLTLSTILVRKSDTGHNIQICICDACSMLSAENCDQKHSNDLFAMGGYKNENIYQLGHVFYSLAHFEIGNSSTQNLPVLSLQQILEDSLSFVQTHDEIRIDFNSVHNDNVPNQYSDLIRRCISIKPVNRPTITQCISILKAIKVSCVTQ